MVGSTVRGAYVWICYLESGWTAIWAHLGQPLGCLGGLLGGLGGILGGLGAVLDRSWAVLVVMGRFRLNKVGCPPDLAQFLEPKRGPRWSQNATQEGPKSKTKTKMKKEGFEDRLGAVLGRSWVVLGAVLGSKSCSRPRWRSFF